MRCDDGPLRLRACAYSLPTACQAGTASATWAPDSLPPAVTARGGASAAPRARQAAGAAAGAAGAGVSTGRGRTSASISPKQPGRPIGAHLVQGLRDVRMGTKVVEHGRALGALQHRFHHEGLNHRGQRDRRIAQRQIKVLKLLPPFHQSWPATPVPAAGRAAAAAGPPTPAAAPARGYRVPPSPAGLFLLTGSRLANRRGQQKYSSFVAKLSERGIGGTAGSRLHIRRGGAGATDGDAGDRRSLP